MQGDAIVNRIINDANLKVSESVEQANKKASEILSVADNYAKELSQDALVEASKNAKDLADRYTTLAKIEGNKVLLNKKQNILKDLKSKALSVLLGLKHEDMLSLIKKLIKENASKGETLFICVPDFKEEEIANLKEVKDLNLTVKENKNKQEKGLILSSESCDKNLLFKDLIDVVFEQNQEEIVKILF